MTTTSDGSAKIKIKTESENGESSTPPNLQPVAQEEEAHLTHSFKVWLSSKSVTAITCNEGGTVEDVLKRNSQFNEDAKKHRNKELIIIRDGKAISSHFPCNLIRNKDLTLKYVKAVNKPEEEVNSRVASCKKEPSRNLLTFHVLVKGGKNVVHILKNPKLKEQVQKVTVYAYKGEKVKHALKRDGRFLDKIFIRNCALSERSTKVTTEMSNPVDDLGGKTFQIILLNKLSPPDSQSSSLDDADESQDSSHESTTTDLENNHVPEEKLKLCLATEPEIILHEIPGSKKMYSQLSSVFINSMKGIHTQVPTLSRIQNVLRVEYGKNDQTCKEVKTMKTLMELSDSVCQVRINGRPEGSGFLLFGNYVLTNAHVIKDISHHDGKLNGKMTVHFSFDDLTHTEGGSVVVEEVVVSEYLRDVPPCDWALLKLSANRNLPRPLAARFGFLPKSGAICIIGHPGGGVKKIDTCLIVPTENCSQVVERQYTENQGNIQLITSQFFENVAKTVEQKNQTLMYESCFYHGSSGSPVFDKYCNVVAMHAGGYQYPCTSGQTSVIEYGLALSDIMEHMIIHMVERQKFDELKDFLTCNFSQPDNILMKVKMLVDRTNLTTFQDVLRNSVKTKDTTLKKLFKFFSSSILGGD